MNELMQNKIKNLPEQPGCYIYRNSAGDVIYVGKAKNLKNRVRTYFHSPDSLLPKTRKMISEAESIEYFVTDSETEAFMLETNLIKQHRPYYNILMKDDKNYPYIKLTLNEEYPRLLLTRKRINDKSRYFGPYLNTYNARKTIDAICRFFPMKRCNKSVAEGKVSGRVCLNYHIGLCPGVCTGKITKEEYIKNVETAKDILSGNNAVLTEKLTNAMYAASEQLNFEAAMEYKELIACVSGIFEKQKINDSDYDERDIIGLYCENSLACAVVFKIREGKLTDTQTRFLSFSAEESAEVTEAFLNQYYMGNAYIPREIIVNIPEERVLSQQELLSALRGGKVRLYTAARGDKKRLMDMAQNNARLAVETQKTQNDRKQEAVNRCLNELKEKLKLPGSVVRIESYDISNISGTENVGVMVAYENAKKLSNGLRKFRIKYTIGQDDYASTAEVLFRRLTRAKNEMDEKAANPKFLPLPQLIFADGGFAHVKLMQSVINDFGFNITVAGLVKDSRHRLKGVVTNEGATLPLADFPYSKLLLNEISEEVHRQAIGYHRLSRSKAMLKNELTAIPGIGEARALALLKAFGNIEKIKAAGADELIKAEGMNRLAAENVEKWGKSL